MNGDNGGWEQQKRQFAETKPMEWLNESIEMVERNQWNRWTNAMASFTKNGGFARRNRQSTHQKPTKNLISVDESTTFAW